jgi:hypothetical protein
MIKRILAVFGIVVLVFSVFTIPASAIDAPDLGTTLDFSYAYQNILETNDMGFMIGYHLNYSVTPIPSESASQVITIRLLSGIVELGNTAPYSYFDRGYQGGVAWLYFSAADVAAKGMAWGAGGATVLTYTAGIIGNPLLAWAPGAPSQTRAMDTATTGTSAVIKLAIASQVLAIGMTLGSEWNAQLVVTKGSGYFLSNQETSTSGNGESYFPFAIPNLRNIAPSVFLSQSVPVIYPTVDAGHIGQLSAPLGGFSLASYGANAIVGQTFTPPTNMSVATITAKATRLLTPGNVTCYIYSTAGGHPNFAGLLGTSTAVSANTWVTTGGAEYIFTFATPVALTGGTVYGYTLSVPAGDINNSITLYGDTNVYAGGQAMRYNTGTLTWTDYAANDFYFDIAPSIASYKKSVEGALVGTPFDVTAAADALGVSRMVLSSFIILVAIVLFIVTAAQRNPNASRYSTLIAVVGIIFGTALGGVAMIWVGIIGLAATFVIAYIFGIEKAGV